MEGIATIIGLLGGTLGLLGGLCAVIVPLGLLAGLGVFLYRRSQQAKVAKDAAQSWPKTKGMVLKSRVESRRTGNTTSTYPVVVYRYEVNGKTYESQTIKAGDQFMSVRIMGDAQKTVDRYSVGNQVTVYYNPAKPSEAALER
jgi:hypothetical protein